MKVINTKAVELPNGDVAINVTPSGESIVKTSDCVTTYSGSEMKEVYSVNVEELYSLFNGYLDVKNENIEYIKKIIAEHGNFTVADVEAETSPCTACIQNTSVLVESFGEKATLVIYEGSHECGEDYEDYECLSNEIIEEIVRLAEDWEAICLQTEKRIS